jgi:hypothetical protein
MIFPFQRMKDLQEIRAVGVISGFLQAASKTKLHSIRPMI